MVADAASQATLNALLKYPQSSDDVPIRDITAFNARGSFSPKDDAVIVSRVAMLMDPTATPIVGAKRSLTTTQATTNADTVQGAYTAATNPFLVTRDDTNALLE